MTSPDLDSLLPRLDELRAALARAVVGQNTVVEQLLIGLLAGGHCLLEGAPGSARPCWCARWARHWSCSSGACSSPPT